MGSGGSFWHLLGHLRVGGREQPGGPGGPGTARDAQGGPRAANEAQDRPKGQPRKTRSSQGGPGAPGNARSSEEGGPRLARSNSLGHDSSALRAWSGQQRSMVEALFVGGIFQCNNTIVI